MSKRLLIVLVLLLVSVTVTQAQEEAWPVVQNCMGDLNFFPLPSTRWDFPGVIVSSVYPEGLRGIRADLKVEYFIAMEAGDSFPTVGAVSPDGQYFAYPVGYTNTTLSNQEITDFNLNADANKFGVNQVRTVRADGDTREKYNFDAETSLYGSPKVGALTLPAVKWFGAEWVYYPAGESAPVLTNFKTGETKAWAASVSPDELSSVSPDGTRAFSTTLYALDANQALDYATPAKVVWFGDSSAFIAVGDTLELVDRDGSSIATPWQQAVTGVAAAPNGQLFAFWDAGQKLYVGDKDAQVIYDLCFTGKNVVATDGSAPVYDNLAWSPDSSALAFSYDNYVVILNTQTFVNVVLKHYSLQVMGWYPLATETVTQVSGIRPADGAEVPVTAATEVPAQATSVPQAGTCELEVITAANLRMGAGADTEKASSVAAGTILTADTQKFNEAEYFRWWRLTSGQWIREDFVKEGPTCDSLPQSTK